MGVDSHVNDSFHDALYVHIGIIHIFSLPRRMVDRRVCVMCMSGIPDLGYLYATLETMAVVYSMAIVYRRNSCSVFAYLRSSSCNAYADNNNCHWLWIGCYLARGVEIKANSKRNERRYEYRYRSYVRMTGIKRASTCCSCFIMLECTTVSLFST